MTRQLVLRLPDGQELRRGLLTGAAVTRLAAGLWWRTTTWTVTTTVTTTVGAGSALTRAAISGQPPAELMTGAALTLRRNALRILGVTEDGPPALAASSRSGFEAGQPQSNGSTPRVSVEQLRERATE